MAPGTAPAGASSASHPASAGAHHATDQVPGRAAPSPLHAVPGSHTRDQRSPRPPAPTPRPLPPPAMPEPLGRPPHHLPPQVLPRRTAPAARSAVRLSSPPPGTNTMIAAASGHYRKLSHVIVSNRWLHPPRSSATHETAGMDRPSRSSAISGAKFPGSRSPDKTLCCESAWARIAHNQSSGSVRRPHDGRFAVGHARIRRITRWLAEWGAGDLAEWGAGD